jgi:hypothetical protein
MKFLLLPVIFFSITVYGINEDKILHIKKIPGEIIIDGEIDTIWSTADSAFNFFQLEPYYAQPPSASTTVKVLSSDEELYCIFICKQDKDNIENITATHDELNGDAVSFMFDSFNDKRTAYKFAVSASGVTSDSRILDDGRNRDYNWDAIWFAASKIYDWGYIVEIKIPYKSIQYDKNYSEWGLDFDRWIAYTKEDLYWCSYEENEGQRVSKFGRLLFDDFKPAITGLNLEIYPVALTKAVYINNNKYKIDPEAGLDLFYNPSQALTYQLTLNPDFAQIEADPFDFNISRYESYFSERRPFFTQGNEIFMPSGKERGTGFYSPLELFYSRRIGKRLPDGTEVPLIFGTKGFGRFNDWEYGGFMAMTGETHYNIDDTALTEPRAYFASGRIKKQIFRNSSIGVLYVGKFRDGNNFGVLDIDGAFREADWQLSYQIARSFKNSEGDFGGSAGFTMFGENWLNLARLRSIGDKFDVNEVGFVPWRGTTEFTALSGPRWFFNNGYIRQVLLYAGPSLNYEKIDHYLDYAGVLGYNMQFRDNWAFELNYILGKSKDQNKEFHSYQISLSSWYNISPRWSGNLYGGYSKTYNFRRDYLAFYTWLGSFFAWKVLDILEIGTSYNMFVEGNPQGNIEDITYNTRPYFTFIPVNYLTLRVYVDNVYVSSTDKLEQLILGVLFSWNFSPKSWIYFAFNEFKDRSFEFNSAGIQLPQRIHVTDRAAVLKIKYLYYF